MLQAGREPSRPEHLVPVRTRCGIRGDSWHGAPRAQPLRRRQMETANETAPVRRAQRRLVPSLATVNGPCQQSRCSLTRATHHSRVSPDLNAHSIVESSFHTCPAQRPCNLATRCCEFPLHPKKSCHPRALRSYPIPPLLLFPSFYPLPRRSCLPF